MITRKSFDALNQTEQVEAVVQYGVQIGDRNEKRHHIKLYQLGSFYVEVFFNKGGITMVGYRSFEDTDDLQPYIDSVNIEGFLKP